MLTSDIAIIGMAGRFPDAADVEQLYRNLCDGRESLRPISAARIAANTLEPEARFRVMGYLEDIDCFDHQFFGIPFGEARKLSPNVRLAVEETWHAFESAACPPGAMRGTRTDVYMTQVDSVYMELADEDSATLFTGNAPEFVVGRLNRLFDLRGISAVVDTACSSGLAALFMACDALHLGRADYAVVCGTNLCLFPYDRPSVLETTSPDGRSRSYSVGANGMVAGEVVVCFLLTTLARAESKGHPIQAVIRGGALNTNGAVSNSPSAPNSVMQAEAMLETWTRAGISPGALGFIEGHGSATRLGDSLEIEAFRMALKDRPRGAPPCALSAIKANIGHGKSAAALSSLVKAVLSVQRGVRMPAPNAQQVNPVLLKADSPVYVNAELVPWPDETRLAAVHAYGMSGVNCCVVIENYPDTPAALAGKPEWFPVPISARSRTALRANAAAIGQWVETCHEASLPDIAHTLSLGREHLEYRRLILASDREGLLRAWDEWLAAPDREEPSRLPRAPRVLLLFSHDRDDVELLKHMSAQLMARFPIFRQTLEGLEGRNAGDAAFTMAFQIAMHALLGAMGMSGTLVGGGAGQSTVAVLKGTAPAEQAMRNADAAADTPLAEVEARVSTLVSRLVEPASVVFVQMGADSIVSRELRRAHGTSLRRVEALGRDAVTSLHDIVARLFADGWAIRFEPWFEERQTRAIRLPGYQFARTRCWVRDAPRPRAASSAAAAATEQQAAWSRARYVERKVAEIWRQQLGRDGFGPDDNVFELGADSLMATRVVRRINQELDVRCDFEDVFDYPTVTGLAGVVRAKCSVIGLVRAMWREVLKVEAVGEDDDFFELGGHSLLANEIMLRARQEFGTLLSFDDFVGVPTPSAFARVAEERLRSKAAAAAPPETPAVPAHESSPLTPEAWGAMLERREMY